MHFLCKSSIVPGLESFSAFSLVSLLVKPVDVDDGDGGGGGMIGGGEDNAVVAKTFPIFNSNVLPIYKSKSKYYLLIVFLKYGMKNWLN